MNLVPQPERVKKRIVSRAKAKGIPVLGKVVAAAVVPLTIRVKLKDLVLPARSWEVTVTVWVPRERSVVGVHDQVPVASAVVVPTMVVSE